MLKKTWKQSLTTRLVLSFLLLSLLVVGILGIVAGFVATETIKQSVFERLDTIVNLKEDSFNKWIDDQIQNVVLVSMTPALYENVDVLVSSPHPHNVTPEMANPVEVVREVLAAGMDRGEIPARDPDVAASMVLGIVLQVAVFKIYQRLTQGLTSLADALVAACWRVVAGCPKDHGRFSACCALRFTGCPGGIIPLIFPLSWAIFSRIDWL